MNAPVWYCVQISSTDMQAGRHIAIQKQFEAVFRHLGGRHNDVALYSSALHGDAVTLYFSPATNTYAASFLREIHAKTCEQPEDVEGFVVGHTGTMRRLLKRQS